MRICLLANAQAVHTQRWASALAARGHDVTVLGIRAAAIDGVRVVTECVGPVNAPGFAWTALSYARLLARARAVVAALSPDVVNAHYCVTHGVIATLARLAPRVVNLWGSDVMGAGHDLAPRWRRPLVRLGLRGAAAVVSTSHAMLAAAQRQVPWALPAHVVAFGVDLQAFVPRARAHGDEVVVGFAKSFSARYAPTVFVQAAAIAARRDDMLRFVMAGRGPLLERCRAQAARAGLAGKMEFPGFVPHARMPALLQSFDVLVNCSRIESFGVVICEAAASGLPVVATDVGGVRETVVDGETGVLVPADDPRALADAICGLASDAPRRREMGAAGRRLVAERYAWSDCVSAFEAVLEGARR